MTDRSQQVFTIVQQATVNIYRQSKYPAVITVGNIENPLNERSGTLRFTFEILVEWLQPTRFDKLTDPDNIHQEEVRIGLM
jgi:hypothetical protein